MLPAGTNAEPGKFRNARTPYLRGVADAVTEPGVEEIVFVAGTQVGKTTAQENQIGYWIDNDPGPLLIVRPSEASCEEYVRERLRPMLDTSPSLRQHLSQSRDDNTLKSIRLDTMPVYLGWAGSPQSLASRPCRFIVLDEVDKFPEFSGREADPISLALERTATYLHRRRIIITSTPTTEEGAIWQAYQKCGDRRSFLVPCSHCSAYQKLVWSQVKWPRLEGENEAVADQLEQGNLATYECEHCRRHLTHGDKLRMLDRGVWASAGQGVTAAGQLYGERPKTRRVGFHLSSLYSPWRSFSSMAAEFVRSKGDIAKLMNFKNSRLAEPFEQVVQTTPTVLIREKCKDAPAPGVIPAWAQLVVCTADTQGDWFRVVVRAWGSGFRSQGLFEGECGTFDELYRFAFSSQFTFESGGVLSPTALLIDSGGTRTDEVYQFSLRDPRIVPTKGYQTLKKPWYATQLPSGAVLRNFSTHYYKDMLSRLIHNADGALWLPRKDASDSYVREMGAEHKILDRQGNKMVWKPKTEGAANHAWDCEVLSCLAADMAGLGALAADPITPAQPKQDSNATVPAGEWLSRGKRW